MMTEGLKRRQTYEEVIDYIENDKDKIKYPDRTAKQLRNTFELSQLDGRDATHGTATIPRNERTRKRKPIKTNRF